jgi:sugar phosphate isomerase/epimerase
MKTRRDFLKASSLAVAGGLVAPKLLMGNGLPGMKTKRIGLQLYSMRQMISSDGIQAVLEAVAKVGYQNLEAASYADGKIYGLDPVDFRKRVEDLGMVCTSAHLSHNWSEKNEKEVWDWWDQAIEAHHKGGFSYMVQPSMPVSDKSPISDLQTYCEYFSKVGERVSKSGMKFGYHNHTGEFRKIGNQLIYDYMLAHTDKKHMMFELDVYWCHEGGADPVAYLKQYADRIKLAHIKDEKEIGASGKMDFKPIFDQMNANKMKDWYVEIEAFTNGAIPGIMESLEYLEKATYVKG